MAGIKTEIRKMFNHIGIDVHRYDASLNNLSWLYKYDFDTFLDIGANVGSVSLEVLREKPHIKVIAFEPLKDAYSKLQSNLAFHTNYQGFNLALGDSNGQVEFHRSSHATSSSVLPMADLHKQSFPSSSKDTIETVEIKRLDDLIMQENILLGKEVFTKIDVQGFEYDVLLGGVETISKSKVIICEVSFDFLYEDQKLFDDVYKLIQGMGFLFVGMLSQIHHPNSGRILQANAIFQKVTL
jgi:FkbM family methyltransferase